MVRKPAKVKKAGKPKVHQELDGFEISVDQFGEIKSNMNIEKINNFLNEKVADKKLAEREDYEVMRRSRKSKKK